MSVLHSLGEPLGALGSRATQGGLQGRGLSEDSGGWEDSAVSSGSLILQGSILGWQ